MGKNTMTYSVQSSEEQQYLPISYDGRRGTCADEYTTPLPEEDEVEMFAMDNEVNSVSEIEKKIERKMSQIEEMKRKRSRGSIVRSELRQLSKHMADVLHAKPQ